MSFESLTQNDVDVAFSGSDAAINSDNTAGGLNNNEVDDFLLEVFSDNNSESGAQNAPDITEVTNENQSQQQNTDLQKNLEIPTTESCEKQTPTEQPIIDYAAYKLLVDEYFNSVKTLLRYNKEKDNNINSLAKQVEKYKGGLSFHYLKAFAVGIVGLREDCKKSLRDCNNHTFDFKTVSKYISYLQMDFGDFLENNNITASNEKVTLNGKDLNQPFSPKKASQVDIQPLEIPELPDCKLSSVNELSYYLQASLSTIKDILANNTVMDKLLSSYIEQEKSNESGIEQLMILYPAINKIASVYLRFIEKSTEALSILTEENCNELYKQQLIFLIDGMEASLEACQVSIDGYVSDKLDTLKHRVVSVIDTSDEEKHGMVANRYTDCYLLDGKIIYPMKVDIYKKIK